MFINNLKHVISEVLLLENDYDLIVSLENIASMEMVLDIISEYVQTRDYNKDCDDQDFCNLDTINTMFKTNRNIQKIQYIINQSIDEYDSIYESILIEQTSKHYSIISDNIDEFLKQLEIE